MFMSSQSDKEIKHQQFLNMSTESKQVKKEKVKRKRHEKHKGDVDVFPPKPLSEEHSENIIKNFCEATSPPKFEEAGCAVCGQLTLKSKLVALKKITTNLHLLSHNTSGLTRMERLSSDDPIQDISGPVLSHKCDSVCKTCYTALKCNRMPKFA